MDFSHLIVFAAAYLALLATPGAGVTALVSRVLARGSQGAPAFIAGIVGGALVWFTVAATGLAVLAASFSTLFIAIRYAGAAYLLYVAWKLWNAPVRSIDIAEPPANDAGRLFLTGLAINLGNPKAIAFFLALLPTVVDLSTLTPLGFVELAAIVTVVASSVLSAYAFAAARARRLLISSGTLRRINRGSSVVMAGTAVALAARG